MTTERTVKTTEYYGAAKSEGDDLREAADRGALKRDAELGAATRLFLGLPYAQLDTAYQGGEVKLTWRQLDSYKDDVESVLPQHLARAMQRAVDQAQDIAAREEHRAAAKESRAKAEAEAEAEAADEPVRQSQSYEASKRDALEEDAADLRKDQRQSEGVSHE